MFSIFRNRFGLVSLLILFAGIFLSFGKLSTEDTQPKKSYQTEYVVIVVIDGPRLSETFGDSTCKYIPNLSDSLAPMGVLIKNFKNYGPTFTNSGHTAITTGVYQKIKNDGSEYPKNPSIFQYFLKEKGLDSTQGWIIASKGKLNILGNTKDKKWKDQYLPTPFCGIDGKCEGYTNDRYTWRDLQPIFTRNHPKLTLVNFLEVDVRGHQNEWPEYLQAIKNTDQLVMNLWKFIQSDSLMKDKTTMFVTNDHGRHLNGRKDAFVSHGDNCEGCRSIYLVAIGPDFKTNVTLKNEYELIDISKTVAELLDFDIPTSEGEIMIDLFK